MQKNRPFRLGIECKLQIPIRMFRLFSTSRDASRPLKTHLIIPRRKTNCYKHDQVQITGRHNSWLTQAIAQFNGMKDLLFPGKNGCYAGNIQRPTAASRATPTLRNHAGRGGDPASGAVIQRYPRHPRRRKPESHH